MVDRKPQRLCGHSLALTDAADAAVSATANDETMVRPALLSYLHRHAARCFLSPAKLAASSSSSSSSSSCSSAKVAIDRRPRPRPTSECPSCARQPRLERVIKPFALPLSSPPLSALHFHRNCCLFSEFQRRRPSRERVESGRETRETRDVGAAAAPFSSFVAVAVEER